MTLFFRSTGARCLCRFWIPGRAKEGTANREQTACSEGLVQNRPSDALYDAAGIGIGIGIGVAIAIEFARLVEKPFSLTDHASQLEPIAPGPGWGLDRVSGRGR